MARVASRAPTRSASYSKPPGGVPGSKAAKSLPNAGAGGDFLVDDPQVLCLWRICTQFGPIGNLAPAGGSIQAEGGKLGDLLDDFRQRRRSVDVLEDAAAALFELGHLPLPRGLGLDAD